MSSLFWGRGGLLFLGLKFNFIFTRSPLAFEAIATISCNKRECCGRAGLIVAGNETGFSGTSWATPLPQWESFLPPPACLSAAGVCVLCFPKNPVCESFSTWKERLQSRSLINSQDDPNAVLIIYFKLSDGLWKQPRNH